MILIFAILFSSSFASASKWDDATMNDFLDAFESVARPTRPPRHRQWDRYRANSSLVGLRLPCSAQEKNCLLRRQLFDASSGRCMDFGQESRDGCRWALDSTALMEESILRAKCVPKRTAGCPWGYRMAYDGRCFDGYMLFTNICARERGLEPALHATGAVECVCADGSCDRGDIEYDEANEGGEDIEDGEEGNRVRDEEYEGERDSEDEEPHVWCRLPPLHALVVPPTEAPIVADVFSYHFDHSEEREH